MTREEQAFIPDQTGLQNTLLNIDLSCFLHLLEIIKKQSDYAFMAWSSIKHTNRASTVQFKTLQIQVVEMRLKHKLKGKCISHSHKIMDQNLWTRVALKSTIYMHKPINFFYWVMKGNSTSNRTELYPFKMLWV